MHDPIPALKQQLAAELYDTVAHLHPVVAAGYLGVDPRRLSEIRRGALRRFSLEKLIRLLDEAERTVAFSVSPLGERHVVPPRYRRRRTLDARRSDRPKASVGSIARPTDPVTLT